MAVSAQTLATRQALLMSSYRTSARRIEAALKGGLIIQNTKTLTPPPGGSTSVVGLCGQGGRHHYFAVAQSALETCAAVVIDRSLTWDELVNALGELRNRTTFNDRTGCANDAEPMLVPLLPPEEVWCGTVQLPPLDVWRLLAFDLDFVAAAINQDVDVRDLMQGVLSDASLGLARLLRSVTTDPMEIPITEITGSKSKTFMLDTSLREILWNAGVLLTPAAPTEASFWHTAVRYAHWLAPEGKTVWVDSRLRDETVDARYRGLFSEEFAVGIMATVLIRQYAVTRIVDTAAVMANIGATHSGPIADFVARTGPGTGVIHVIESKGSLGRTVSEERREHAREQVEATRTTLNTKPLGPIGTTTCATTVYFSGQNRKTNCTVERLLPPKSGGVTVSVGDPTLIDRAFYAKVFRFVGLHTAADQVLAGAPVQSLNRLTVDRPAVDGDHHTTHQLRVAHARRVFGAELVLDLGEFGVMIECNVVAALRSGEPRGLLDLALREGTRDHRSFVDGTGVGLLDFDDVPLGTPRSRQ